MDKATAAAIIGSLSAAVVAIIASLSGLGEHAPGVVAALLFAIAMSGVLAYLVRQLEAARAASEKRESDYATVLKDNALALQSVATAIAKLCERDALADELAELRALRREWATAKEVRDAGV